ncbi:MAG: hypothetical protein ABI759_20015 [Candidatus Solibacter sp.]
MAICRFGWLEGARTAVVSEAAVDGLRQLAIDGLVALRRRGIEVGGLLMGSEHGGEVRIEGFEEVPCEHFYGPSYTLSERDRAKLEELLATWPHTNTRVIGFFRSFTARDPVIDEADEAFVREHFPDGWFVYLLLQPLTVEQCVASVRTFRDGILLPETEASPRPFLAETDEEESQLVEGLGATPPASAGEPEQQTPADLPRPFLVETDEEESQLGDRREAMQPVPLEEPAQQTSADLPPVIQLSQSRTGGPRSVAGPPPVLLEVPASQASAASARVIQPPRFRVGEREAEDDRRARWWIPVSVCLACLVGGAMINQLVHSMGTPARGRKLTDLHLDARPMDDLLEVRWDSKAQAPGATRGRLEVTDGSSKREFELDAGQLRSAKITYAPSHPDVRFQLSLFANGAEVAAGTILVKAMENLAAKPGEGSPGPRITARPAEATLNAPPPDAVSATPPPAEVQPPDAASAAPPPAQVPPAEVRTVQPAIPAGIRSRMSGPLIIPVEVKVNARGRVVRAVAEKNPSADSVYRYLAEQARVAAFQWRFRPARTSGGEQVAASKTLRFVFTP